jgi:hypothetical protein
MFPSFLNNPEEDIKSLFGEIQLLKKERTKVSKKGLKFAFYHMAIPLFKFNYGHIS